MTTVFVDSTQFDRLSLAVAAAGKSLRKEIAAAVNASVKDAEIQMARDIGSEITMKIGEIKKNIRTPRKATEMNPEGVVSLSWAKREGLQYFNARQTKKGVTYKISKKRGRGIIPGAFMGPSPGVLAPKLYGGVFKRVGSARLPIAKLRAVSAAGVFLKNKYEHALPGFIREKLTHQLERRINLNVLRANGLVPN